MAKKHDNPDEVIIVEVLIALEGSAVQNRITTFELPIVGRPQEHTDTEPGVVEFESSVLIRNMIKALKKLV